MYTVRISVLDQLSGFSNTALTVPVIVRCTKSITVLTDIIPDIFRANEIDPAASHTHDMPTYGVEPTFCPKQTFVLTIQYVGVPIGTALPSWLNYD